jgi:hypothetical protein
MSKTCCNCGHETKRGVLCPSCDAVIAIRIHFESFVTGPLELGRLLEDLERANVETAKRLLELAEDRQAMMLAGLAKKCLLYEWSFPEAFARSLRMMRRPAKPVEYKSVAEAVASAVDATTSADAKS